MVVLRIWISVFLLGIGFTLSSCGSGNDISEGTVLRRGISDNPNTIDPQLANGQWENIIIGDMFLGLFTDAVDGNPIPGVAESWNIDESQTVWTFKLKDTNWSDGEPLTAYDFEYSFRRIMNPATAASYASLLYMIKNAEMINSGELSPEELGIKAIDAHTLELTLEHPAPYLPGVLKHYVGFPVPKHVIEVHGDSWTREENFVSNGAYKLVEWRTGDYLKATKNQYFEGKNAMCFEEIYYFPQDDLDTVERMVRAGKLDTHDAFAGQKRAELEEFLPGWVRTSPGIRTTYISFNQLQKPFDDSRVRHALAMALDRDFMTEEVLASGFIPAYAFVPPGINNYPGGVKTYWADKSLDERLLMAKTLLEEVGYGPDNPLKFDYIFRSTDDNPRVAPVIQGNWRAIADWVHPIIQQQDTRVLYSLLRSKDFSVSDGGWVADYNDPQNFLYLLDSATGQMNYGSYSNSEYDALLLIANQTLDLKERGKLLAQAEQIMMDDMPISPMWFQVNKNLVNPNLKGWEENPEDLHRSRYLCRADKLN